MRRLSVSLSVAVLACSAGPGSRTQDEVAVAVTAAPLSAQNSPSVESLGERLDLNLLMPSHDGDSLVAWSSMTVEGGHRLICGIRLSTMSAHCAGVDPAATVETISANGRLVALSTPTSLVVRETLASRVVIERPTSARALAASISPDNRHVAFLDERGRGSVIRLDGDHEVSAELVGKPVSPDDYDGVRGLGVQWVTSQSVVFSGRGIPTLVTLSAQSGARGVPLTGSGASPAQCSAAVPLDDKLLVATCDGQVGLFDPIGGAQIQQLLTGSRHRGARVVSLRVVGERVLAGYWSFGDDTRLELLEPFAANPLGWSYTGEVTAADLRSDGRTGWQVYRMRYDGISIESFEKGLQSPPRGLEGRFVAWSGNNLVTEEQSVTLRVGNQPVFAHYASWAPEANTVRRGSFLWVSGGSSMVRIADNDPSPLVFDVFGTVSAPVVKRVPPTRAPPPQARAEGGSLQEEPGVQGGEVGGSVGGHPELTTTLNVQTTGDGTKKSAPPSKAPR